MKPTKFKAPARAAVLQKSACGFSLVEVVVAVGIFALAIVGVIGLLVPTSKTITEVADADSASRAISAIQSGLQKAGYTAVRASLVANPPVIFYATKDGSKVGASTDTTLWPSGSDQEKFFEFRLVRNGDVPTAGAGLSPAANDATAGFLAFTIVLKWPAFAPTADGAGIAVDDSQKSTMVVPAAITR
jgi:type II secretory pathway pseudopilin PulG